jgi:hypothetical protein
MNRTPTMTNEPTASSDWSTIHAEATQLLAAILQRRLAEEAVWVYQQGQQIDSNALGWLGAVLHVDSDTLLDEGVAGVRDRVANAVTALTWETQGITTALGMLDGSGAAGTLMQQ